MWESRSEPRGGPRAVTRALSKEGGAGGGSESAPGTRVTLETGNDERPLQASLWDRKRQDRGGFSALPARALRGFPGF